MRLAIDDRTEIRSFQEQDTPQLHALSVQNRVMLRQWFPGVRGNLALEGTRRFIATSLEESNANKGLWAGIWHHGRLAGAIDLHGIDSDNKRASVAYWLDAEFQSRGLMTKVCRVLVDHAFNEVGLNRIEIQCAVQNSKSRAVSERLGFVQEGVIRQAEWLYDHYNDHAIYGMLAKEWRELSTPVDV